MAVQRPIINIWYDYIDGCFKLHDPPFECIGPEGLCSGGAPNGHLTLKIDKKKMACPERIVLRFHNRVVREPDLDLVVKIDHDTLRPLEGEPKKVIVCPDDVTPVIIKKCIGLAPGEGIDFDMTPDDGCHHDHKPRYHTTIHVEC